MNNNKILLFLFILSIGCAKGPSIAFQDIEISEKTLDACNEIMCPTIHLSYPQAEGDFAPIINLEIQSAIIETLSIGEEGVNAAKTIGEAIEDFIAIYQEHKAEYFDMTAEYEAGVDIYETFRRDDVLCFQQDYYKFTGGAHGYGGTSFILFDLESGQPIQFSDLVTDLNKLTTIAEKSFRKEHNLPENENINSNGFLFEEDRFQLPEAIGFEENDLVLIYNPYEIAPYADGQIEVRVPLKKIEHYLRIQ